MILERRDGQPSVEAIHVAMIRHIGGFVGRAVNQSSRAGFAVLR